MTHSVRARLIPFDPYNGGMPYLGAARPAWRVAKAVSPLFSQGKPQDYAFIQGH